MCDIIKVHMLRVCDVDIVQVEDSLLWRPITLRLFKEIRWIQKFIGTPKDEFQTAFQLHHQPTNP